jgi:hypothetical protein
MPFEKGSPVMGLDLSRKSFTCLLANKKLARVTGARFPGAKQK